MAIVHIVLLKFKPSTSVTAVQDLCSAMLALAQTCVRPETGEAYILNMTGGANSSGQGAAEGLTHAFVSIFASEEDRAYYLDTDPAHQAVKQQVAELVERLVIVDYEPSAM